MDFRAFCLVLCIANPSMRYLHSVGSISFNFSMYSPCPPETGYRASVSRWDTVGHSPLFFLLFFLPTALGGAIAEAFDGV